MADTDAARRGDRQATPTRRCSTRSRREYHKGRLLLIGTTDLDAQRPVIWNIGALAASGHPKALDLFRKILRASAAIPGAFQPVLIDVEIDGQQVPGDACRWRRHRPALPLSADHRASARSACARSAHRLHHPQRPARSRTTRQTERRTISIAGRAITTMLAASGQNDVLRTYFVSQRDGVDYNLAYIGTDFTADEARRVRPGLHAGAVRLRLPRGEGRPGLAQGAARAQGGEGPAGQ